MKKKGFTLIELLAVIVILAIIALIATPMIIDVIEKSKRGAAIDSVNGILNAAEHYQINQALEGETTLMTIDLTSEVLTYKGAKPESGILLIDKTRKMSVIAKYGDYCIEKKFADESPKVVEREECEIEDSELLQVGETAVVQYRVLGYVNHLLSQARKYISTTENYQNQIDLVTTELFIHKGSAPESGTLLIDKKGNMSVIAQYGEYCVEKKFAEDTPTIVQKNPCTIVPSEVDAIRYSEVSLNGADPVLKEGLIPVIIGSDGTVKKADTGQEWYNYGNKEWANAVILKDATIFYNNEDIIPEENIESYFVWIPKYSYQLWNLSEYSGEIDASKVHSIPIKFGLENTNDSKEGECTTPGIAGSLGNCQVGDYMTHPAFIAFNTNGIWVGKFETAQSNSKIAIKPNLVPWKEVFVGQAFKLGYDYKRDYDSHMMKNTEWGAVAYLAHSKYGINGHIERNAAGRTGYAGSTSKYNTATGFTASTTGNITGIYDMSGGALEYVMGVANSAEYNYDESRILVYVPDLFKNDTWRKYYDLYSTSTAYKDYILGDATGELGPFSSGHSSWYNGYASMVGYGAYCFSRGGSSTDGTHGEFFSFNRDKGYNTVYTYRVVLSPQ